MERIYDYGVVKAATMDDLPRAVTAALQANNDCQPYGMPVHQKSNNMWYQPIVFTTKVER